MASASPPSPAQGPTSSSAKGGGLFRDKALAKNSSPDHLDQLVHIVPPLGWLTLWTIVGILAAAVCWGFLGRIPETVQGRGILLRGGVLETVVSPASGHIKEVTVKLGDLVEDGSNVAILSQKTLEAQIENQKAIVADFQKQFDEVNASAQTQLASQLEFYTKQKASVETSITSYTRQSDSLKKVVTAQQQLLQEGLIPMTTLLQSQTQLDTTNLNILQAQNQLQQIETNQIQAKATARQSTDSARISLQQAQSQLGNLDAQLAQNVIVKSPVSGRVVSVDVARGQGVNSGTQVVVLERLDQPMVAVLFFQSGIGKRIQTGMVTQISPAMAPVDQYGYIQGNVTWVGDVPATQGSLMASLANSDLVTDIASTGPVLEVGASVLTNKESHSGFQWSSSRGPKFDIPSGTLCTARVVTEEKRPIELVIPMLKKFFGIGS